MSVLSVRTARELRAAHQTQVTLVVRPMSVAQVGWWSVVGVARIDEEVLETDLTHKRRMHYID